MCRRKSVQDIPRNLSNTSRGRGGPCQHSPHCTRLQPSYLSAFLIIVLGILGISGQAADNRRKETKDMLVFAQRVVSLLGQSSHFLIVFIISLIGERFNGVWSHQVENEYSEKYQEQLPSNWITKMEEINQIRIESPIPDSIR